MGYNNYTYAICNVATDMQNIEFNQVITSRSSTARRSVDKTLFLIKWNITEPSFITSGLVVPSETMTHQEVLVEMQTPEWTEPPE